MRSFVLVAIAVLSLSGAAIAQNSIVPEPVAAPKAKEKRICRASPDTGTRMAKSVCRTRTEWNAIAEANQLRTNDPRNRSTIQ